MNFGTQARADRRVLFSAALMGAGLGLALGAGFMAVGMADAVQAHSHSQRMAAAAADGFSQAGAVTPADPAYRTRDAQPRAAVARLSAGGLSRPILPRHMGDLDCLTQAVYFEARGETTQGQAAVAQVVLNRVRHPAFPKTVCGVVYQGAASASNHGCQFSFACDGSTRRGREAGAWQRARLIAARALAGSSLVSVGAATHFHTTAVNPGWGPGMLRVTQVGLHVFYQLSNRPASYAHRAAPVRAEAPAVFVSLPTDPQAVRTLQLTAAMASEAQAPAAETAQADAVAAAAEPAPAAAKVSEAATPRAASAS